MSGADAAGMAPAAQARNFFAEIMEWNVIATVREGPGHERALLSGLRRFGEFHPTEFKYVCVGRVDAPNFLETVRQALAADEEWTRYLARLIPVERTFHFDAQGFVERLKQAVAPFAERMGAGCFYVRIERRGMLGQVHSQEAEREVADYLVGLLQSRDQQLRTDFHDPDWIVACETLGAEAGVALLDRETRRRYDFVQAR